MNTNLDKFFKTSEDLEKNGVWFDLTDEVGFKLKPFKSSNPQVKAAFAALYKPHIRQIQADTLDPDKEQEITIKMFIKASLVDWRGVVIDGEPTAYSPEVALKFFKALPDLFQTLWEHCQDYKNYKEEVGNSSAAT